VIGQPLQLSSPLQAMSASCEVPISPSSCFLCVIRGRGLIPVLRIVDRLRRTTGERQGGNESDRDERETSLEHIHHDLSRLNRRVHTNDSLAALGE